MKNNQYLFVLLLLAAVLEFWKLGTAPVKEFDEARYAANAVEMMRNGDYLNLYYHGKPDAWVARPPLKAWLIIGGYELLGFNEWGLRLSSGIAVLVFLFFAFRLINLYLSARYAFLCGLMLISVKGIIGFHVGRNADMDAELIALLTAFTYFFLRYLDTGHKHSALWAGLMLGLSFWMKTMACFYYIPGLVLYLLLTGRLKQTLSDRFLWQGLGLFAGLAGLWLTLQVFWGADYDTSGSYHQYGSSLKTMLLYDTWDRFTASSFDKHPVKADYGFFIHSIDSLFNVWNYFFYAGLILYVLYSCHPAWKERFRSSGFYSLCTASLCILLPIALLLTLGMHKLPWYTTPSLLWLSVMAAFAVHVLSEKIPYFIYPLGLLILFALVRHFLYLEESNKEANEVLFIKETAPLWQKEKTIYYFESLPQNVYVYFLWQKETLSPAKKTNPPSGSLVLMSAIEFRQHRRRLQKVSVSNPDIHHQKLVWARSE